MVNRVKYTDINPRWFNAKCLNLIGKYASHAHYLDNVEIRVNSESCLVDVIEHAEQTDSLTLKLLCRELKDELRMILAEKGLRPKQTTSEQCQTIMPDAISDESRFSYHN